jgi:hypothetical protein
MEADTIIKLYLKALENSDYTAMLDLFVDQAYIDSPLYGMQPADTFYLDLFGNTIQSRIRLLGCFTNSARPEQAIGYFAYYWHLKDGSKAIFDCVDIFELDLKEGKIRALKIIYDTFHAPPSARQSGAPPPPSVPPVTSGIPTAASSAASMGVNIPPPQSAPAASSSARGGSAAPTMPPAPMVPRAPAVPSIPAAEPVAPPANAAPTMPPPAAVAPPAQAENPSANVAPTMPPGAGPAPSSDDDGRPTLPPGGMPS